MNQMKIIREDKEYLIKQNANHHCDEVVNKTIEKDVDKHSSNCTEDNRYKFAEFIFDNSEEKISKNIKNSQVDAEKQRESIIIFLKKWRLARFILTFNLMEKMKKF